MSGAFMDSHSNLFSSENDVQHVLDGNPLGHFAVKKIAVGESHSYLLKILKEVRLLERLHHPNIITYQYVPSSSFVRVQIIIDAVLNFSATRG
jgi:serine/threonine protein kinase